ncbi:MAG: hypothetical protein CMF70_07000 [Magnetovibrio sp.]|nr:hypothetical protein [Magnetovibrio sp.]|tara:strand:+ start:696 stop:1832 length:1137 start_codon:yes stop_codon:yes gene_type:complete
MSVLQGYTQKYYAVLESAFGAGADITGSDAIELTELKLEPSNEFVTISEHKGTASPRSEARGKFSGSWSCSGYLKTRASGQKPSCGVILDAAFGNSQIFGPIRYSSVDADPNNQSMCLVIHAGDYYAKASGAIVEQLDIEQAAADLCKFTASGSYAAHSLCYGTEVSVAGAASGETEVPVDDPSKITAGAVVTVGGLDNSGSGYKVASVGASSITLNPALEDSVSQSAKVSAYTPAQSLLSAEVIPGTVASLSIDGSDLGFISFKASLKTGIHLLDKEVAYTASGAARAIRELESEISCYFSDDSSKFLGSKAIDGELLAVSVRLGPDESGKRVKISMPQCRIELTSPEIPEAEEATASLSLKPKSLVAGDEIELLFD